MSTDNKYYRTYDANNQKGDFDDHDKYITTNLTGKTILNELTKGDPFSGIVKLVNTAKQNKINTELTNILEGPSQAPLDSIIGRLVNMDNIKFQYGMNDLTVDKKYFVRYVDKIEDPTILTFTIEFDENNSPLFKEDILQFIGLRRNEFQGDDGIVSLEGLNFSLSTNIGGLYDQIENILNEFKSAIRDFFTPYQSKSSGNISSKSYYITSISGVSELDKVWTGSGKGFEFELSRLKLKMREDVKLSARNLYFLYNSLRQHRRSGKMLIPENLLRFNMWIRISEIRNFTSLRFAVEDGANRDIIDAIKRDVTAIYYYVTDCNFDFSKLHREGAYSVEDSGNHEDFEFDIVFRRAMRIFKPTLLNAERVADDATTVMGIDERSANAAISSKNYPLNNFNGINVGDAIRPSLIPILNTFNRTSDKINRKTEISTSSKTSLIQQGATTQSTFQKLGKFLSTGKVNLNPNNLGGLEGKVLNLASQAVTRLAQAAKNTVIQKRNQLVRDLENKVKNKVGFGLPRPTNIYKPGEGSGVIGNTLQSLSKATGIDFLALREGRNIQSFSNTDVQTLNPALEGRDILSGPGGDYSKLNPNKASSEIANLQPHSNFNITPPSGDLEKTGNYVNGKIVSPEKHNLYQEISGQEGFATDVLVNRLKPDQYPIHNLQPHSTFKPDTSVLKSVEDQVTDVKDTSVLKNIEPVTPNKPDLSLLKNIEPVTPNIVDTSILKNVEGHDNSKPDTSVLKNIEPVVPNNVDLKQLDVNLQTGPGNIIDTGLLKSVEPTNVKVPDNSNTLTNVNPKPTLSERISFKNVYKTDQPVVAKPNDVLTKIDTTTQKIEKLSETNVNAKPLSTEGLKEHNVNNDVTVDQKNTMIETNLNPKPIVNKEEDLGKIDTKDNTSNKTDDLNNVNQ